MASDDFVPKLLQNSIIAGPDSRKLFVLEEKGKKWVGKNVNKKKGFTFQIDKDLMKDVETKKCDKGLFLENNDVYLVELKGVDFNTACKQLRVSLDFCREKIGNYNYFCRVVARELPSQNNYPASYRQLLAKLPKERNIKYFDAKSNVLEENV